MGKFNYKKWINENKWEGNPKPLNEQGGGSATVKIRRCTNNNLYTYCLPNASSYNVGHQFRFQTFQGIRNGFLESFVQLGCSTPAGGSYSNINIIISPYTGSCPNGVYGNVIPDDGSGTGIPGTSLYGINTGSAAGPATTGSVTGSGTTTTGSASTTGTTGNVGTIEDPCEEFSLMGRREQEDFCRECSMSGNIDPMCRCCPRDRRDDSEFEDNLREQKNIIKRPQLRKFIRESIKELIEIRPVATADLDGGGSGGPAGPIKIPADSRPFGTLGGKIRPEDEDEYERERTYNEEKKDDPKAPDWCHWCFKQGCWCNRARGCVGFAGQGSCGTEPPVNTGYSPSQGPAIGVWGPNGEFISYIATQTTGKGR